MVTSAAEGSPLHDWDVLTRTELHAIDDQGSVPFNDYRVDFGYDLQLFANLTEVSCEVVRAGKAERVTLPLVTDRPLLIPDLVGTAPSYFVFGPLVFSTVTSGVTAYISSTDQLDAWLTSRGSPLVTRRMATPAFPGEQLVFVPAPFFPHKLARGYTNPVLAVVRSVNGIPIRNLNHLVEVLRDAKDEFIRIEFWEKDSEILVFSKAEMVAATDDILNDNNVRSQGSPDTMAVWNGK